jgi:sugar O-acyltransferase (sialic acid O-acetyltransferase NeuD family)
MSKVEKILVPLLNPNELEAKLIALLVSEGQKVDKDELLGTLETTKSTVELNASLSGYIRGLAASEGDLLRAGEIFCIVAEDKNWKAPKEEAKSKNSSGEGLPEWLRITQPALKLAEQQGIAIGDLPIGPVITEAYLREQNNNQIEKQEIIVPDDAGSDRGILVYGGGGHGKAVIELIHAEGKYQIIGVIDDGLAAGTFVLGVPVLGAGEEALAKLNEAGCKLAINAVGGIGAIDSRIKVFERLEKAGYQSPALVHPSAVVEPSAILSPGAQIFPQSYVGSSAKIGRGVIVNTGAIVSHDCELADYANIAPGAVLAGGVRVGEGALLGMGVTVNLNVSIGERARVGNSAVIKDDVEAQGIVRAGAVWPK